METLIRIIAKGSDYVSQKEFIEYIEALLSSKEVFYQLSGEDQLARNARRAPKKRWDEDKITRAIDRQWQEVLISIYNKVKTVKGRAPEAEWLSFINGDDFIESIDQSITEIEFD